MLKLSFSLVMVIGLCACNGEQAGSEAKSDDIRVTGDLSNGNIVKGLLIAIDKKNMNAVQNMTSKHLTASFEVPLESLESSANCDQWSINAVDSKVLIARDCRHGERTERESYYLTIENTGASMDITSLSRNGKTVRIH